MFRVDYITQDLYLFENAETNGHDWSPLSLLRGVSEGSMVQFAIKKKEPLRAELEAFISHIQDGNSRIVNGHDARAALRLAMALVESSWTGQVLQIPEDNHGDNRVGSEEQIPRNIQDKTAISPLQPGAYSGD